MCRIIKGFIFDLDGVLVSTSKYHYLAWKEVSNDIGIDLALNDNERLKGVSRSRSLEIILELGGFKMCKAEQERLCARKNEIYLDYINSLQPSEVLPGVREFLEDVRKRGLGIALGSASKNARLILRKIKLTSYFNALIDGTVVSNAKPDPEVFIKGAEELGIMAENCVVLEDAAVGIDAAHNAGMIAVGIGSKENLPKAGFLLLGFQNVNVDNLIKKCSQLTVEADRFIK